IHRRRGEAGRAGDVPAGALLRSVFLPGTGHQALQLHGENSRRSDDEAHAGARQEALDGAHRPDVRGRPGRRLLQHRRGHRCRREIPRQIPKNAHPAREWVLGEVLLPSGEHGVPRVRHRRRQGRRVHLLRPALPGARADARSSWRGACLHPVGHVARSLDAPLVHRADGPRYRERLLGRDHQPGGAGERVRPERVLRLELFRRSARQDHRAGLGQGRTASRRRSEHGSRARSAQHLAVLPGSQARHVRRHGEAVMATTATRPALNYIGGVWVESTSREHVRDVNPARSSESLGDATVSRPEDVVQAIDAATAAYQEWRRTPAPQRGDMVRKAADLMELRRMELARLLTQEEGKTLPESLAEVDRAIANVRFAAGQGLRLNGETMPSTARGTFVYTVRDPLGVVACITPWNFPIAIPAWKIAPALVAGNTVVFKPATLTPLCAAQVVQSFVDAGVPEGVLNMVLVPGDGLSRAIVDDERFTAIFLTVLNAV